MATCGSSRGDLPFTRSGTLESARRAWSQASSRRPRISSRLFLLTKARATSRYPNYKQEFISASTFCLVCRKMGQTLYSYTIRQPSATDNSKPEHFYCTLLQGEAKWPDPIFVPTQLFSASYHKTDSLPFLYLLSFFLFLPGKPFNAKHLIHNAVSNIICCLVFGERFEYTDQNYQKILQAFDDVVKLQGSVSVQVSPFFEQNTLTCIFLLILGFMD